MDKPFSVLHWGSHPDLDNDDCWTGEDFDTVEEAIAFFHKDPDDTSVEYIEIDGIADADLPKYGIERHRKNPYFIKETRDHSDREWQSEYAMQQGMGLGIDAYNEAMGWD